MLCCLAIRCCVARWQCQQEHQVLLLIAQWGRHCFICMRRDPGSSPIASPGSLTVNLHLTPTRLNLSELQAVHKIWYSVPSIQLLDRFVEQEGRGISAFRSTRVSTALKRQVGPNRGGQTPAVSTRGLEQFPYSIVNCSYLVGNVGILWTSLTCFPIHGTNPSALGTNSNPILSKPISVFPIPQYRDWKWIHIMRGRFYEKIEMGFEAIGLQCMWSAGGQTTGDCEDTCQMICLPDS
jgi:hypothetical protein